MYIDEEDDAFLENLTQQIFRFDERSLTIDYGRYTNGQKYVAGRYLG